MSTKFAFWILMICMLMYTQPVWSADPPETLEPIEVRATRSKIEPEKQTSAITVITSEEIKEKQHMQVLDILREQPGINVVTTGPLGGTTTIFLRGAGSQSTLVMIDGVQMKSNTVGSLDFANLQMDNIEQIEILRGPQSTLWGADAVGGVINIVTKKGKGKPTHSLAFEGGSFGTFKETLASSGALNSFDYSASVSRTDSAGFSAFDESLGGVENDSYQNTTLSTRLGYGFLGDGRVEFIGRYIRARNDFDSLNAFFALSDTIPETKSSETFYIAIPVQKALTDWWDVRLNSNVSYDNIDTIDTNPFIGNSKITSRTYTVDLQNNVFVNDWLNTLFGFEHQVTNGENTSQVNPHFELENRSQGYYLQGQANYLERAFLTAGIRYDVNSQFKNKVTYKFETAYMLKETGTKFRAGYATGFRVPSVNEVLFPFFGNPAIQPEESKNWEVGIEQNLFNDKLIIGANYFETDYTNLIVFDPATFIAQNIGSASSNGVETYIKYLIMSNLDLNFNYTFNESVNDATNQILARRPKNTLTVALHHNYNDRLDSLVSVNYRSGMVSGTGRVGGRTVVRAAFSYQYNKSLKLTLRAENLLDKNYQDSFQFGTAGISAYAGFVYSFN